jgi:hypothetical protein
MIKLCSKSGPVKAGLACFAALAVFAGCDFPGGTDPDPPLYQTDILEIRVTPNPVVMGDTAVFEVVIRDSLDERFSFRWTVQGEPGVTTSENRYDWAANRDPGTYGAGVLVYNDDRQGQPPDRGFLVTVVSGAAN